MVFVVATSNLLKHSELRTTEEIRFHYADDFRTRFLEFLAGFRVIYKLRGETANNYDINASILPIVYSGGTIKLIERIRAGTPLPERDKIKNWQNPEDVLIPFDINIRSFLATFLLSPDQDLTEVENLFYTLASKTEGESGRNGSVKDFTTLFSRNPFVIISYMYPGTQLGQEAKSLALKYQDRYNRFKRNGNAKRLEEITAME